MRVAALAALALAGCASFSTLQRADVLPEGQTRIGVAPLELSLEGSRDGAATPLIATVRQGLGHDWEVGGRFWLVGASVGAKYQFLRARRLAMSVSPELLVYATSSQLRKTGVDLALPLLAGIPFGEHQLILGARAITRWNSLSRTGDERSLQVFPGAVLGLDFVAPGSGTHVLPELNLSYWPGGHERFWTATVGFYFDPAR